MKYVPNILSITRLILIIPILLLTPLELPFVIVYIVAGTTDFLDGPIARKFNVMSTFGAKLDSVADVSLVFAVLFRLAPIVQISQTIGLLIIAVIIFKFIAVIIGVIRHKQLTLLHTYFNKFFVFSLFFFPLFYVFFEADHILSVMIFFAFVAFAEEAYINATSKIVNLDDKGLLFRKKLTQVK